MAQDQITPTSMYCRKCGYQLVGLSESRCPECGKPFNPADVRSFSLYPRGYFLRRWARRAAWAASIALVFVLLTGIGTLWIYWDWQEEQPVLSAIDALGRRSIPNSPAVYGLRSIYIDTVRERPTSRADPTIIYDLAPVGPSWLVWLLEGKDITSEFASYDPLLKTTVYDGGPFHHRFRWLLERVCYLKFQDIQLASTDVMNLQKLRRLETLELCGTEITDAGLSYLASMPHLTSIDLSRTSITDAGLLNLSSLKNLRDLNVTDTRVTPEGVRRLKLLLPTVNVRGPNPAHE